LPLQGQIISIRKTLLSRHDGNEKALWPADIRVATFVEAQELIGGASDADADSLIDWRDRMADLAQPEWTGTAEVETVVTAVDLKRGRKPSWAAGEIEKPSGPAMALHEPDAFKRFDRADKYSRRSTSALAHDIQHEVRAVIEKNVGMAGGKIHRANSRSRSAEVMSGGIAGWISFRLHNAAAESAGGKIVDDNFSDEKTR
jgi:hypothetical protein